MAATHLSKPIIIDLGYILRADKAFNLTPIEQTAGKSIMLLLF